jgi:hypothetical protein
MKTILIILQLAALLFVANGFTYVGHEISRDASKQIANGIKNELYISLYSVWPT